MALTRITKGVIKPNENYDTHNINSTGIVTATKFVGPFDDINVSGAATFSGNVSIAGTLTYEDVTNVDSVGIITARDGIHVGAGVSVVGILTASVIKSTNLSSDRVVFTTTGGQLEASGNLTYDGVTLASGSPFDLNADLDVDGHTNLDNVNIAGIVTATSADINGDLDVDGHTNLDNVSIAGVSTFSGNAIFNDKVGIGSAIPEQKLKINVTSGNDGMVVQNTSTANIALIGARNGDATLQIGQYGSTASGNVFGIAAANLAFMYTTSYASTHPSALLIGNSSNKDIIFATNATARVRIHDTGQVTIGSVATTTDASGILHTKVSNTTSPVVFENDTENADVVIRTTGTNKHSVLGFGDGGDNFIGNIDYDHQNNNMVFDTAGGERLRIGSGGIVTQKETGTGNGQGGIRASTASAGGNAGFGFITGGTQRFSVVTIGSAGSEALRVYDVNNSAERFRINASGTIEINQSGTNTNVTANDQGGPNIWLKNTSNTDGNYSKIGFFNSTGYITAFMAAQYQDAGDRNTDLVFGTRENGGILTQRLRITSSGQFHMGGGNSWTYASQKFIVVEPNNALGMLLQGNNANEGVNLTLQNIVNANNAYSSLSFADDGGQIFGVVRGKVIDKNANTGELQFWTSGAEALRITSDGKVLVGDGGSITPSRHLDVRGTGQQQILIGSTNNQGASLMLDGHGGGDGSGGNYGTMEMGSDGNLDIRNYDPAKSIIFGTGSNTGANDSVVIESTGKTRIKNAELSIESSASYTTHLNYNNSGTNYISTTNGGATYFRGSSNSLTSLVAHGGGNVELPTANYEFTENNFRSKSSATENGNTAQFSNAMTSLMGSYHSSNNTNGIMDFPDYKASDWTILEVYGKANPNTAGSGAYSDPFFMTIYKGGGYTYPNVVTTIFAVVHTPAARTMYSSGTGNSANDGITAVWYNGSSESTEFTYSNSNNAANYLRIKVPTGSFNTTYGMSFACRIFRRY